jgi:arylsulfatase
VAGVELDSVDAEGVLYAHGGVAGGHSLYVKDKRLKYVFNWVGEHLQTIEADREITAGRHVLAVDFSVEGPNRDPHQLDSPARRRCSSTTSPSDREASSRSLATSA